MRSYFGTANLKTSVKQLVAKVFVLCSALAVTEWLAASLLAREAVSPPAPSKHMVSLTAFDLYLCLNGRGWEQGLGLRLREDQYIKQCLHV